MKCEVERESGMGILEIEEEIKSEKRKRKKKGVCRTCHQDMFNHLKFFHILANSLFLFMTRKR